MLSTFEFTPRRADAGERSEGFAVLIAVISLSLFSLMGIYMTVSSMTELRASDNYESRVQAHNAARAGLAHARQLLPGHPLNDLLKGPDGTYTNTSPYLTQARAVSFRNLLTFPQARAVNMASPSVSGISDDGIISTGLYNGTPGTSLIPLTGIALTATNPYGGGTMTTARYFAKVSDNNGEASELAGDAADNPFVDGDAVVILRSVGIARTVRETDSVSTVRANSVAIMEARYHLASQFGLTSPFVVQGSGVAPSSSSMFNGNAFDIDGLSGNYGVSVIDTNIFDGDSAYSDVYGSLAKNQQNNIKGLGGTPSIADITTTVQDDPNKSMLLDPAYMYNFVNNVVPTFADHVYTGPLKVTSANASTYDLGYYDYTKPYNHPVQRPVVTVVQGDLEIGSSGVAGGAGCWS